MLDINKIRQNTTEVTKALSKRGFKLDAKPILSLDENRKELLALVEAKKAERNKVSGEVPKLKKEGKDTEPVFNAMRLLGEEIHALDGQIKSIEDEFNSLMLELPNTPDEDVMAGGKENNKVIETFGKKPEFAFKPKNHVELCTELGLIDYERGVKLSGNGFWAYRNLGARLEWALLNFFVDEHLKSGYEFILPPLMLLNSCGYGAGQFPKFKDEVYGIVEADGTQTHFMAPTAETSLVNFFSGEIIPENELPKKMFAYTPCFRTEAGSYRAEERGMVRGHQFNKVEMVQITTPENSDAAFDELVAKAKDLLIKLGLHFVVSKLAAGDVSASMARTFDLEVWIPSMGIYKEVSSASNARDYQARRMQTRYRTAEGKNLYVHTLNASGLATSRLVPAIVEQFQQADGSVRVPDVLVKYMGVDVIKPLKKES